MYGVLHNSMYSAIHCLLQVSTALQAPMGGTAGMVRQAALAHWARQVCKGRPVLLDPRVLGA